MSAATLAPVDVVLDECIACDGTGRLDDVATCRGCAGTGEVLVRG